MLYEYHQMSRVVEERYQCFPSFIPEFYAVNNGLKPLCAQIIPAQVPAILRQIRKLCEDWGLHAQSSGFRLFFDHEKKEHIKLPLDDPRQGGDLFLFVSKDKRLVHEAVHSGPEFEANATYFLGYPACCVKSYEEIGEDQNLRFIRPLKRADHPSFFLNNFLHWDGPYYLISHFPCTYECEGSIQYARRLLAVIQEKDPSLGKAIRYLLTRPTLYNGQKSHVRFNGGFVSKKEFLFDNAYGQRYPSADQSFLNEEETLRYHNRLIDSVEYADRLIFDAQITIMNKSKVIDTLPVREDTVMIEWR